MQQMQAAAKWDTGFAKPESELPVRSSELVVLRRGWLERAKDCIQRAQAHAQVWGTGNDTYQRLMERAAVLQDCARDLEIKQHNNRSETPPTET